MDTPIEHRIHHRLADAVVDKPLDLCAGNCPLPLGCPDASPDFVLRLLDYPCWYPPVLRQDPAYPGLPPVIIPFVGFPTSAASARHIPLTDVSVRGCYTCPLWNVSCCLEKSSTLRLTSFFAIEEHYFTIATGIAAAVLRPSAMSLENALQLHGSSKFCRCAHPPPHRHVLWRYCPHRPYPFSVDEDFVTKMMTHRVLRTVCLICLSPCPKRVQFVDQLRVAND